LGGHLLGKRDGNVSAPGQPAVQGGLYRPGSGGWRDIPGLHVERSYETVSELIHERPGVYSTYDASTVVSAGQASRAIGVAAKASAGTEGEVVILTSYAAGVSAFGEDETP